MAKKAEKAPEKMAAPIAVVIPIGGSHGVDLIAQAVASVRAGDAKPEEIIVAVDTPHFSGEVPAMDGVRVVYVEEGGDGWSSGARNVGAAAATAEWLFFLDVDDFLMEDALSWALCAAREAPGTVMVCPLHAIMDRDGSIMEYTIWQEAYKRLERGIGISMTPNVLIQREFFMRTGGFDAKLSIRDDCDLAARIAGMQARVVQGFRAFVRVRGTLSSTRQREDFDRIRADVKEFNRRCEKREYLYCGGKVIGG